MRAHVPDPSTPRCPDCGSRHYPATLGDGTRAWCGGTPTFSGEEALRRAREREEDRRAQLAADARYYERIDDRGSLARARQAIREVMRHEHARRMLYCGLPIDPNTEKGSLPDRI